MTMYNSDVQRTEPNHTGAPRKIGSITTAQVGTTTQYPTITAQLNRQAKNRTFTFINKFNQQTGSIQLFLFDSTIPYGNTGGDMVTIGTMNTNTGVIKTSEANTGLASHSDSITFVVPAFTTAPTTGTFDVYVTEIF